MKRYSRLRIVALAAGILTAGICYCVFCSDSEEEAVYYIKADSGYEEAIQEEPEGDERSNREPTGGAGADGEPTGGAGVGQKSGTSSIYIHICGEVANPGIYRVEEGTRVGEAIQIAGGLTIAGDGDYINQARRVTDGERLYIPSNTELSGLTIEQYTLGQTTEQQERLPININTATAEQLMQLSGIGAQRAQDIIRYREENGEFKSIEDIMLVSGIKNAAFQKICEDITVNN